MKAALFVAVCVCVFATRTLAQEGVLAGVLPRGAYATSGTVRYLSTTQIRVENFNYDGPAPAVFFYAYSSTPSCPNPHRSATGFDIGTRLTRDYSNEAVTLDLPPGRDVCGIGTFTVWCALARITFTCVTINPSGVYSVDSSGNCILEGMSTPTTAPTAAPTSTSPQNATTPPTIATDSTTTDAVTTSTTPTPTASPAEDNCIGLHESFQLSWTLLPETEEARFTLCGCQSLIPGINRYVGFGLSGDPGTTLMFGADPVITWVDQNGQPNAEDYYLSAYVQCRDGRGACPDTRTSAFNCTNDVRNVSGSIRDGVQCVTYTRSFAGTDECDRSFVVDDNSNNYVVWAFGELGETAFKHSDFSRAMSTDQPLRLGREPRNDCRGPPTCSACLPFNPNQIIARESTTFRAEIGPSASDRGYVAATNQAGWGIAWYIDGDLAPELVVERGKSYTFIVSGGDDRNNEAEYHPFYITDSIMGGRLLFTTDERADEVVYSGFDATGNTVTAAGALCQYKETARSRELLRDCGSYDEYTSALVRECNSGQPATLVFTPDETTPDTVYYQCAFHLSLGWRIRVLDEGEPAPTVATFFPPVATPDPLGAPSVAFFRLTAVSLSLIVLLAVMLQF